MNASLQEMTLHRRRRRRRGAAGLRKARCVRKCTSSGGTKRACRKRCGVKPK